MKKSKKIILFLVVLCTIFALVTVNCFAYDSLESDGADSNSFLPYNYDVLVSQHYGDEYYISSLPELVTHEYDPISLELYNPIGYRFVDFTDNLGIEDESTLHRCEDFYTNGDENGRLFDFSKIYTNQVFYLPELLHDSGYELEYVTKIGNVSNFDDSWELYIYLDCLYVGDDSQVHRLCIEGESLTLADMNCTSDYVYFDDIGYLRSLGLPDTVTVNRYSISASCNYVTMISYYTESLVFFGDLRKVALENILSSNGSIYETEYSELYRKFEAMRDSYHYQVSVNENLQTELTKIRRQYGELDNAYDEVVHLYADSLDSYQELKDSVNNAKLFPELLDGIYSGVSNVIQTFLDIEIFGISLSSIVGILVGACIAIIVIRTVI